MHFRYSMLRAGLQHVQVRKSKTLGLAHRRLGDRADSMGVHHMVACDAVSKLFVEVLTHGVQGCEQDRLMT